MDQGPTTPPLDLTQNQTAGFATTKQSAGKVDLYGRTIDDTLAPPAPGESLNTKLTPPLAPSPTEAMPHSPTIQEKYKRLFNAAAVKEPSALQLSFSAESGTSATRPMSPSEIGSTNLPPGVTIPSTAAVAREQLREPSPPPEARIASVPEQHSQVTNGPNIRRASSGRMAGLIVEGALRGSLSSNFNTHARDNGRSSEPGLTSGLHVNRHSIGVKLRLRF